MIRNTLQILAYRSISSTVVFLLLRASLSASIATSGPIVLRCLKQSATVFAGLNRRTETFNFVALHPGPEGFAGKPNDPQLNGIDR